MASKVLPKSVLNAPKRGLSLPMKSWMKSELSNFVQENLNSLGKREIIRKNAIENTLSEWKNGTRSQRGVWQLVSLEIWMKQYLDRNPNFLPSYLR